MKPSLSEMNPGSRPRLSLQQKIMVMARRYRAAEKRRKQKDAVRSKRA
jgi:hypothetical protein